MKHRGKNIARKIASIVLASATAMSIIPVSSVMAEDQNVAQIGNTKYSTIKAAWAAVQSGGEISILKNWDTRDYGRLIVNENANVIVNMDSHSINRHIASDDFAESTKDGEVFYVKKGATLTINGGTDKTHNGRISQGVWYEDDSSTQTPIKGGVIVGGNSTNGAGGIHVKEDATVTLNDVTIAGNMADKKYGGGLRLDGKNINLTLNNSHIMYNRAKGYGGGIYVDSKNCSIDMKNRSSISYNSTAKDDGGAMYSNAEYTSVTMDDYSEVSYNTANDKGGGFYFNYSKVSVKGGKFEGNKSLGGGGGAIYLEHYQNARSTDSVAIANVTFIKNEGAGDGGAIHSEQEYANFSACTITENKADRDGGGIYIYNDKNTITGCTITNNTAGKRGGGVFLNSEDDAGLGGKVIIDNNWAGGKKNNLYLEEGTWTTSYIESAPGIGSKIGVTRSNDIRINCYSGNYAEKYFYADDKENQHVEDDGSGYLYMRAEASVDTVIEKKKPITESVGNNTIKGYFSYPSIMDTKSDVDGTYYYSDSYFENQDPKVYNNQLATMSICMAMAAFNSNVGNDAEGGTDYTLKSKNIVKLLNDIGVKRDDIYLSNTYTVKPGTGTIGVAIGQKVLSEDENGSKEILVPIAVRGAGYESEWTSNVTVGKGNEADKYEHAGFADAANQVFTQVQSYIQNYGLSEDVNNGKVKFWVTGYSRAGATANLTARRLVDTYGTDKVFAYCMEAPKGAINNDTKKYANIHNCINFNDPVPKVAPGYMGFTRYGKDEIFNQNTTTETKKEVKQQLRAVSDDIAYNDRLTIGTLDLFGSSMDKIIFCIKADMLKAVGNPTEDSPKNLGDFMDAFLEKFKKWAINDRAAYTTAPIGDNDLRENNSSLKSVSFEESLQLVMPMVFSKSDEEMADMMDIALKRANELSTVKIYFGPILGKWNEQSKSTKQKWIWDNLWYQVVEPSGKDGLASKLTPKELTDLKTAWPTLIDRVFSFVSEDYNYKEWAYGYIVVGTQVVLLASDPGLNVIGTLAYNSNALMQAHYPEVNYAWLRSMDDHYKGKETSSVKITTDQQPTVNFNLDADSYEGDQTLKLTAGKDTQGEGIYYKLTTTVNGNSTETTWLPYNNGITLPVVTDAAGTKIKATYKVDVRAVFCNNEITTSKIYKINPVTLYNVTVKDTDGNVIQNDSYAAGEKVTVSAPNLKEQKNKFFAGWTAADGIELKDADKSKETLAFTMPKGNVTLTASYKNLIDDVEVSALDVPTGKNALDKKANVILKGNNEVIENVSSYDVIWTTVDEQDNHEIVEDEKADFNTTYEAVIVLKPEECKREFAKTMKVAVNGNETGKTELQKDGSIWVYCGTMSTGNPKFVSTQRITITAKTGTKIDNLGLPNNILIETEAGPKIATVDNWTCTNYQIDQAGEYIFTAKINLSACGVDQNDETTEAVATAEVNLKEKAKAATPVLKEGSAVPKTYKENQTIYLETATTGAIIKYKLNDDEKEQTYDPNKGILLSVPEDATSGTEKTYKITAYAEPTNTSEMDNSEVATYNYKIVKPYTVTISYKDTGFKQENPWTKEATVTSCIPGEDAYIIAPEEDGEQFAEWETNDNSGITISDTDKTSKLIKVEKIDKDISLTAVYNPVVREISLTIPSPATGEKLAKTVSGCSATITNTYDVLKTFGLTIPITWTPAGNDGTASAYQTYTAKMSMSMDSTAAKFYMGNQATVLVKDARDENKIVPSTWSIEKDADGKDTLVLYATFEKTSKVKAVSVTQPDSVQVEHGETIESIKQKLADKVLVTLADGTVTQATVSWGDTIESYNPATVTEQVGTIKGTITFPDYVDGNGISEVSTEVYVSAAVKTTAPTASIAGGVYATAQQVTLSSEEGATIYYSTDGSEPTIDDAHKYNGNAISITEEATTLKAIAVNEGKQNSITSSYSYYIHKHVDTNGDGKCDGIYTGTDEAGKKIYETCDTVLLGRSNDADGAEASVAGTIVQDDGKGTIYVEVNRDDIVENVEKADTTQDSTTQADVTEADDTEDATWKYSNEVYPTTKLKYAYKPEGSDDTTPTTEHGYIFAGWYKVEKTTTKGDDGEKQTTTEMKPYDKMPTETAYAKFVDATVLSIKAQILANTTSQSETTDMRILTSVDALDYQSVGIEVKYNGKKVSYDSKTVYKKIYALDGTVAVEKDPKEVFDNKLSRSFLAIRLTNIANNLFDVEFKINGYWVTKDGTKVLGNTAIKKVNDGLKLSSGK